MAGRKVRGDHRGEVPRRKCFRLHQSMIDEAMEVLGTSTEVETIDRALELVVFRNVLVDGVREMRGAGLVDVMSESQ